MTAISVQQRDQWACLTLDYCSVKAGNFCALHADCFEWLSRIPENSLHAIVTDPPYGVKEFEVEELVKRAQGIGGVWRIPPSFDGHTRSPLPRFTALNERERPALSVFKEFYLAGAAWVNFRSQRRGRRRGAVGLAESPAPERRGEAAYPAWL